MRGATHAKWAACAVAVALAATACGGGSDSGGGGDAGIVSSSWGDPQNPLEPANTNEVQGGKVLDMLFRGLKRYDPKTGEAKNMLAESIQTTDSQNFTVTLKDGWKFSNDEPVTAQSFVDAWNYGADVRNKQNNSPFFSDIVGYDDVHPASGEPKAKTMSGLVVKDPKTFTVASRTSSPPGPRPSATRPSPRCPGPSSPTTPAGWTSPSATARTWWTPTPRAPG